MKKNSVIAAVKNESELVEALNSKVEIIFDLSPDLMTLSDKVTLVHKADKKIYIHLDLATGIGKDKSGIIFVKKIGVDGIISTRVNIIKMAREEGLLTVQRFFIVDSHSIDTTVEALKSSKADMIEIMPGIIPKVINNLKTKLEIPIIAGGLIENNHEIDEIFSNGAYAISTGKKNLWSR